MPLQYLHFGSLVYSPLCLHTLCQYTVKQMIWPVASTSHLLCYRILRGQYGHGREMHAIYLQCPLHFTPHYFQRISLCVLLFGFGMTYSCTRVFHDFGYLILHILCVRVQWFRCYSYFHIRHILCERNDQQL